MIYVIYLIVAIAVTILSVKAADYVDYIDKKTKLSGAFIGGIMLSAVTSLPELFTSISATVMLDQPGLCIGNILGSDLFNIASLSVLIIFALKSFSKVKISRSHIIVTLTVFVAYISILLNRYNIIRFEVFTISMTSIILVLCYAISVKFLASEDGSESQEEDSTSLSLKQIIIRFILVSIGIIVTSIIISYITDEISVKLDLGKGIAGALFMGIATSLPEVSSSIALFKKKNYNVAVGNIIGSNIFNFIILSVTDILYVGNGIYDFSDPKTINLLVFGTIATPLFIFIILNKSKALKLFGSLGIIACYVLFLLCNHIDIYRYV